MKLICSEQQAAGRKDFFRPARHEQWAEIVYYAPKERKTRIVHSSCKLTPEPAAQLWAEQFYSRGAYTIFPHIETKNAIFPFRSRAGMRHFRPGVRKRLLFPSPL